jgi:hypothetical protein
VIGALAQGQWFLNQDAVIARYEMNLAAAANQPSFQPPPPELDVARSEENKKIVQSVRTEGQSYNGQALLQQGTSVTAEKGLRSFGTLAAFYSVERPIAVERFLSEHTQLVGLLFSAFPRIKSNWGAEIKPEVTLLEDQEGGFQVLMVSGGCIRGARPL